MTTQAPKKANLEPEQDWHPADIKAALEKAGWTLKLLADHHHLSSASIFSRALTTSMPVTERRIAEALAIPVQTIWPSRYNPDGTAKPRGFRKLHSKGKSPRVNGKLAPENRHEKA